MLLHAAQTRVSSQYLAVPVPTLLQQTGHKNPELVSRHLTGDTKKRGSAGSRWHSVTSSAAQSDVSYAKYNIIIYYDYWLSLTQCDEYDLVTAAA